MRRAAPPWLSWLLAAGLVLLFLGERVLVHTGLVRVVLSLAGAAVVLGCLVWRLSAWRRARAVGEREERRVQALLALAYGGVALALLLYFVSSSTGIQLLGLDFASEVARSRYQTILDVLWVILLVVSFLPALGAQVALGGHRRGDNGEMPGLEAARVGETAGSALVIALAGVLLFLVGYIGNQRDWSADLGYFRTSSPGTATQAIARSLHDPLRVLLFFPNVNAVKHEVADYFRALARSGVPVKIEEHDRLAEPELATQYNVSQDGTITLVSGSQHENLPMPTNFQEARVRLRQLDREVQQQLMVMSRDVRTVYLTVGHGELNDSSSAGPLAAAGMGGTDALGQLLAFLNYKVQDLGLQNGLGQDVPADAAMVLVLGPQRPFLPAELDALDRYLARGGRLLLAVPARSKFRLGPLEKRLGVNVSGLPLADDQEYVRHRGDDSDHALVITGSFGGHPAVASVGAMAGAAALFPDATYLVPTDTQQVKPTFFIRTLPSTFVDRNGDFEFEPRTEKRGQYDLAAAVQQDSSRALIYGDAEMFTDAVLSSVRANALLAADAVRWLGNEEKLAGTTGSEADVPIEHTRAEDVGWFYSTILGAPALVLLLGLFGVRRHRRRGRRA